MAEGNELLSLFRNYIEGGYRRKRQAPLGREQELESIAAEIRSCENCGLSRQRRNAVPGYGVVEPRVMLIGEGPGADEDASGEPFVGRAGKYLDKWLAAIGLDRRTNCFITNIVKCRPPGNRDPHPEEMQACLPYLHRQTALIRPLSIVTLGRIASQVMVGSSEGIGKLRGKTYDFQGIPIIPTYHPSGVLRNAERLRPLVWEDLKRLRELIGSPSNER